MKKKIFALIVAILVLAFSLLSFSACTTLTTKYKDSLSSSCMDLSFRSGSKLLLDSNSGNNPYEVQLVATVLPVTATNKQVDWSIVWENSNVSLNISDYLTITPQSDGSNIATLTCLQAFSYQAIVICTTRQNGYTAECSVTYVGLPTEISASCTGVTITNNSCSLGVGNTYSFNVTPSNGMGVVGSDYQSLTVSLSAVGSVVLANYQSFTGDSSQTYWYDNTNHTVSLESLIGNFVTLSYTNGVASITTIKTIESYYESVVREQGGRKKIYTNKYRESVGDCYFVLTLTQPSANLTRNIVITLDELSVSNVSLNLFSVSF